MNRLKNFFFKNTSTKQTVAKNTVWLFLGEILGRILKLVVIVFATRVLGVNGWGAFSYALAFVSVFYVFGDIGINTFITKELSQGGEEKYQYLTASLVLKLGLLLLSLVVSLFLIPHLGTVPLSLKIVLALALLNFSDSLREFVLSINRALERMEREAFIKILINAITTILGIILLIAHPSPLSLAVAYATGSIIGSIAAIWIIAGDLKNIQWKFSTKTIRVVVDFAWPFVATTLFSVVIANIDTIMLGQMKSVTEVGLYAAAERIVQFLAIIPIFVGLSTFPLMAKNKEDPIASKRIFEKIMTIILALAFPIAIGGMLLSGAIMTTVFGASYTTGSTVLIILMISAFVDFPNLILSNAIFARNLQKKFIIATAIGVCANVLLNLYLIPRYGAVGAALSTVGSQLFIMIINWQMLKSFFSFSVVPKLGKIIVANILIAGVIILCSALSMYFIITIVIAVLLYMLILYALKEQVLTDIFGLIL
ncbi:MAG: polysaccharide biosynthesis protein [Candidatus Nomurabacteria bacterium]|nr:polysaccharide biosynthesis protein [Candidatus Nomurabacteria bacterium]